METGERIKNTNKLEHEDIKAMADAYVYGTATPLIWLIKTLRLLCTELENGKKYTYIDNSGTVCDITLNTLKDFNDKYFDDFIWKEIWSLDDKGMYK